MPKPTDAARIEAALHTVTDEKSFIQNLLIDTLDWPIDPGVQSIEEITYAWSEKELRAADLNQHIVDGVIHQIALPHCNWGVFILAFKNPDVFTAERGMTGILRRVLRGLVPNLRKDATQPSWKRENLLFICTHAYEHFRIAHFKTPVPPVPSPAEGATVQKTAGGGTGGTLARLATFGWGKGIPVRTACEFNLPYLAWPEDRTSFDGWATAFDVEKVTRKFYTEYKAVFESLEKSVIGLTGEDRKMFTQSLMNRLMFLRFIERKHWLHFPASAPAGDYLRDLFAAGAYQGKSFYVGRLQSLFFDGLAIEGKQESDAIGKVPFLNGGLFEKSTLDQQVADLPDAAFAPLLKPDGLFYRYNFTVQESTPLDIEVAVDPEMLGKVFEELVTGRHESGSYYTPRAVVSFMCREALKGYLSAAGALTGGNLNPQKTAGEGTGGTEDDAIAAFVDRHDTTALDIPSARRISAALDDLKAVDPACGSGAYLLGLLHEMVDLYRLLYSDKLKADDRSLHDLKLRIISNSIYGVDIDKFATSIAMLRLWLSLSVDSSQPLPLPNLEFKIETGDSLAGPDPSAMPDLFRQQLQLRADLLVRLKDKYLKTHDRTKHDQIAIIRKEEREIAKALQSTVGEGVIDWRIHFAEVFAGRPSAAGALTGGFSSRTPSAAGALTGGLPLSPGQPPVGAPAALNSGTLRGGFDIVLANPPYVRQESIVARKPALKLTFPEVYAGTADLYVFFYARALQCLRPGGVMAFISSNKWFRAGYGKKLRAHIATTTSVRTILDFHDLPVFESAIAYPMIFVAKNGVDGTSTPAVLAEPPTLEPPYPDVTAVVTKYGQRLARTAIGNDGIWHLASSSVADRLLKMREAGPTLMEFAASRVYRGITTGLNEAFLIDDEQRDALVAADKKNKNIIKPFAAGRDIKRWRVVTSKRWIIFTRRGFRIEEYPLIKAHLSEWKHRLRPKHVSDGEDCEGRKPGSYQWFEIQDEINYHAEFLKPKIVSTKVSIEPTFALDANNTFLGNTSYFIPFAKDSHFVLSVLNSQSSKFFAQNVFVGKQNGWYEVQPTALENFPIPTASPTDRAALAALAQKCLDAGGVGCEAFEKEIDERVAALYGL